MEQTVNNQLSIIHRKGAALLVVLFIVMAITIMSLGFLSRSDVELACGRNMTLRTQIDYLAESGLEHARGLILNPQEVESEYWTGAAAQQLVAGSVEYYDLDVVRDDSDPTDRCNYTIDCNAYWTEEGERIGRSELRAQLRLDPCIALWTGNDTTLWNGVTVNGDVYCNGVLTNNTLIGAIDGDVFANALNGEPNEISGQLKPIADLSLDWPRVTVADFTTRYATQNIGTGTVSGQTFGPYNPVRVCYRNGNLIMAGNVQIEGMLVVDGDLIIQGNQNIITAAKKLPALLVTGDLIVGSSGSLNVNGLAVINRTAKVSAGDSNYRILGGLFIQGELVETAGDSSGNGNTGTLYGKPTWLPSGGRINGALDFDGQNDVVQDTTAGSYLNGLSGITVSLWVDSDVVDQDRGIMFTSNPMDLDQELGIQYDRNGVSGGGVQGIKASIKTTSGFTQIESSSYVQSTSWQHLALTWDNDPNDSQLKLYINGTPNVPRFDMGPAYGTIAGVQKLMIGNGAKNIYWDGLIDDVRIYNRSLDADEINVVQAGGAVPGLICHWRFDESGSNIAVTAAPAKTAVVVWSGTGDTLKWGQAAGAFFRSIERR
ncbi:LamG-like jellyroll fold domain-containing protein [Planctomycetota bacterium]